VRLKKSGVTITLPFFSKTLTQSARSPGAAPEAFGTRDEKRLCKVFESKTFGVWDAFLQIKPTDQLEPWHSKSVFSTRG